MVHLAESLKATCDNSPQLKTLRRQLNSGARARARPVRGKQGVGPTTSRELLDRRSAGPGNSPERRNWPVEEDRRNSSATASSLLASALDWDLHTTLRGRHAATRVKVMAAGGSPSILDSYGSR